MAAMYRVTFCHKPTGNLQDIYLSSADAKTTKTVDLRTANRKAIAKAKKQAPKKLRSFIKLTDYVVTNVLCVG
jgi:regulatory protein YycH of two-component signal transduction system YycFG